MQFQWNPREVLCRPIPSGYIWKEDCLNRIVFKRLTYPYIIESDSIVACSGHILRLSQPTDNAIQVSYFGKEGLATTTLDGNLLAEHRVGRMIDCQVVLVGANCSRYQFVLICKDKRWTLSPGIQGRSPEKGIWVLQMDPKKQILFGEDYYIGGLTVRFEIGPDNAITGPSHPAI